MLIMTLAYFALADWLCIARIAGYVCITQIPNQPAVVTPTSPPPHPIVQTNIDRDELILSDLPNPTLHP